MTPALVASGVVKCYPGPANESVALVVALDGQWLCVSVSDGRVLWQGAAAQERYEHGPAVADGPGVLVSQEGVRCLAMANGVGAPPAICAGQAWIADTGGELRALALLDGSEAWRFQVGSARSAPAIAQGVLVVGSFDCTLWCFAGAR